jgi:histidine triad (HIT) family protein
MARDGCAFCHIVTGEIAAPIVFAGEQTLVFLDHRPLFPGHCLVIPKTHYETLADLPVELAAALFEQARALAAAMEAGLECDGALVAINNRVSQSVPHVHIHVVPRRKKDGLRGFFWPRQKYASEAEMERVRKILEEALARRA